MELALRPSDPPQESSSLEVMAAAAGDQPASLVSTLRQIEVTFIIMVRNM